MTRAESAEIASLHRHVKMLQAQLKSLEVPPTAFPYPGCSDHNCMVAPRVDGVGTNGGCRCGEHKLRLSIQWWRLLASHQALVISDQRCVIAGLENKISELQEPQ